MAEEKEKEKTPPATEVEADGASGGKEKPPPMQPSQRLAGV